MPTQTKLLRMNPKEFLLVCCFLTFVSTATSLFFPMPTVIINDKRAKEKGKK